ncbi:MAG: DUF4130 domain-containing protein [Candidatus Hodarchaeota archaeon]
MSQREVWKEALDLISQAEKHHRLKNDENLITRVYNQLKENPELIRSKATEEAKLIHKLAREVGRDIHQQISFLRFDAYPEWLLCAKTTSEHDVLPSVLEHFSERFPLHIILIHDRRTQQNYLGTKRKNINLKNLDLDQPYSSVIQSLRQELKRQISDVLDLVEEFSPEIWNIHYDAQYIKERRNRKLARKFMPHYLAKKFPDIQRDLQMVNSGKKIRKLADFLSEVDEE